MAKRKADGVERVYELAKKRAMDFTFAPGQKIKEGELAAEFGVSRIPVREALNRLVTEGFMTFVPNKGFHCREMDAEEILSLYQVRAALEMWAFRTTCRTAGSSDLEAFCDYWSASGVTDDFESLDIYDARFHSAMACLCGNRLLVRDLRQIEEKILAFRNLELNDIVRRTRTLAEHARISSLLREREGEQGALVLERHILDSAENAIRTAQLLFLELA